MIRIPVQGLTVGGGARYRLNRANLAMNFLFTLNYNMYVEIPRGEMFCYLIDNRVNDNC